MKLNEKNLSAFATSSTPVDKEGWLTKKGDVNKSFQKRWFILKGNLLFYLERKGDKEPVGVIILEGCTIELAEDEEQFCFKIVFHGAGNRVYVLGAETQDSMELWMKALACASYDYMKLMVLELQRQLDELIELEKCQKLELVSDGLQKTESETQGHQAVATAASSSASRAAGGIWASANPSLEAPVPPPRHRHNPFNRGVAEEKDEFGVTCIKAHSNPTLHVKNSHDISKASKTFKDLHQEFGEKIVRDRREWWKQISDANDRKNPEVKEDILIAI